MNTLAACAFIAHSFTRVAVCVRGVIMKGTVFVFHAALFEKVIDMLRPASAPLEFTHIVPTYVQTASRR